MDMSPFQDVLSPKSMRSCDEIQLKMYYRLNHCAAATRSRCIFKIANHVISHGSLVLNMIFF